MAAKVSTDELIGSGRKLDQTIDNTTRKRAFPLIMRSKASAAFSSGKTSFMDLMPLATLKASAS